MTNTCLTGDFGELEAAVVDVVVVACEDAGAAEEVAVVGVEAGDELADAVAPPPDEELGAPIAATEGFDPDVVA